MKISALQRLDASVRQSAPVAVTLLLTVLSVVPSISRASQKFCITPSMNCGSAARAR